MPVYNGSVFLAEAIESILRQTFTDFEFLIIDDCSTDNSVNIIQSYNDTRIRLIQNDVNIGQSDTMNRGLKLARGEFIARMDQDDISLPERLEIQSEYMEMNPNVGVLGCNINNVDAKLNFISHNKRPNTHHQNMWKLLYNTCLMHPTAFIRLSALKGNKYDKRFSPCEDYEFWSRLIHLTTIEQLEDTLVLLRSHANNTGRRNKHETLRKSYLISQNNIVRILKFDKHYEYLLRWYINTTFTGSRSPVKRILIGFQAIFMYYLFCYRYDVDLIDRKWIKQNIIQLASIKVSN